MLIPVKDALKEANLTKDDIEKVVVVGGSSRIPKVISTLEEEFGTEKVHAHE